MTAASTLNDSPLFKATCNVMDEVHGLKKDEKNSHGGYQYVSVDSFKALIRPLMAKHGLSLLMTETGFDLVPLPNSKGGETMNARITYAFQLRHVCGDRDQEERVTVVLPLTGAQTAGAAKSYALKEYLKGRFLVATGDKDLIEGGADADAYKQQEYTATPPVMVAANGTPGASKAANRPAFDRMVKDIRNAASTTGLKAWYKDNISEIDALPPDFLDELRVEYNDRLSELKAQVAA